MEFCYSGIYKPDKIQVMGDRDKCIVRLQYGSYTGEEIVFVDRDAEDDHIIAIAWKQARANFLAMAYRSATIISREPYYGD